VFTFSSLRVGGRAARRSCLPGLRRGAGGRLAVVLSCLVWRCELTAGQARSASECFRRSNCAAGHTSTQTRHRTHLSGCRADSIDTATPETTKQFCLSCLAWTCELHNCYERVQTSTFLSATVLSCRESNSHSRSGRDIDKTVLSCLAWRCELGLIHMPVTLSLRQHCNSMPGTCFCTRYLYYSWM